MSAPNGITRRTIEVPAHGANAAATLVAHTAGRGPVALLLHGYPLDHRMWLDLLRSPLAARRTLVALDQRGHGHSPAPGDATHPMERFAADAAAVLDAFGVADADVVGLSMGGYVAFALAAAFPQRVRSLVLTNTRAGADAEPARAGRDAAIRTVLEQGRAAIAQAMLGKLLAKDADAVLAARVRTMIEDTPVETIVADLRGLRDRPDRTALLPQLAMPTLAIAGDHDPITPPAELQAIAAGVPGARCVVVPGAAHLVPMEQPAAFARELAAFWA